MTFISTNYISFNSFTYKKAGAGLRRRLIERKKNIDSKQNTGDNSENEETRGERERRQEGKGGDKGRNWRREEGIESMSIKAGRLAERHSRSEPA